LPKFVKFLKIDKFFPASARPVCCIPLAGIAPQPARRDAAGQAFAAGLAHRPGH